jgi:LPS-assembly protein
VKWPLVGRAFGGTQVLTPRVQLVASPPIRNLAVPNEDARAIDLEDSNLFALNRFPGYDRIEDGVRFTYGFDWQFERPRWRIKTTVGQSYRLTNKPTLLPDGTGLTEPDSDIVGRTEVRYRDFVKLTHRFRLDKDNAAIRRNEFDAAVGTQRTYVEVGYVKLNRNIDASLEDLRDREELRVAGRLAFARYWSLFGSGVVNLTDRNEDPATVPTASSRCARGWAWPTRTIASKFAHLAARLSSAPAMRGRAIPSGPLCAAQPRLPVRLRAPRPARTRNLTLSAALRLG